MNTQAWLRRLSEQLPGWHVWWGSEGDAGWYAVPAPPGTAGPGAIALPHRLGPYATPQELREAARERYADGDTCQSCGGDWRLCGHRPDETPDRTGTARVRQRTRELS